MAETSRLEGRALSGKDQETHTSRKEEKEMERARDREEWKTDHVSMDEGGFSGPFVAQDVDLEPQLPFV